jgi:hypothetical protein
VSLAFAAPAFLWLLASLPVIVLLHFLRSRTRRVEVSALFLWERAREVAERRRRFTPTWSLLLQLLAATLAALALAQPDLRLQGPPDLVVVIDASASMAAVDPEGARMERAREVVRDLADDAGRVALVRAGTEPRLAFGFSSDRAALDAALEAFTPADHGVDLDRAVALALDLAGEGDDARARVVLIGDDPGPERSGVTRVDVGGSGENIGIVGFDLGIQQAFVAVASNAVGPRSVGVEVRQDGALLASADLLVPSGDQASVTFPIDVGAGVVEARLVGLPATDALSLDDVAYAGQRPLQVVVDADVESVMRALAAVPGVATRLTGLARTTPADVRVLTGVDPEAAPSGDLILLPDPQAEPTYVRHRLVGSCRPVAALRRPARGRGGVGAGWRRTVARRAGLARVGQQHRSPPRVALARRRARARLAVPRPSAPDRPRVQARLPDADGQRAGAFPGRGPRRARCDR